MKIIDILPIPMRRHEIITLLAQPIVCGKTCSYEYVVVDYSQFRVE